MSSWLEIIFLGLLSGTYTQSTLPYDLCRVVLEAVQGHSGYSEEEQQRIRRLEDALDKKFEIAAIGEYFRHDPYVRERDKALRERMDWTMQMILSRALEEVVQMRDAAAKEKRPYSSSLQQDLMTKVQREALVRRETQYYLKLRVKIPLERKDLLKDFERMVQFLENDLSAFQNAVHEYLNQGYYSRLKDLRLRINLRQFDRLPEEIRSSFP
jgi:hypothetical protein